MKIKKGLALSWLSFLFQIAEAGTCSLCRETLQSGASSRLLQGYYWSIILIVSIPLVVIGVGLKYSWHLYKKK